MSRIRIQPLNEPFIKERLPQFISVGRSIPGDTWGLDEYSLPLPEKWELSFAAIAEDETVIGFIFCSRKPGCVHIHRLAVLDGFRGQGIAARLVEQAAEMARQKQAASLTLFVHPDNQAAVKWYSNRGFSILPCDGPNLHMSIGIPVPGPFSSRLR